MDKLVLHVVRVGTIQMNVLKRGGITGRATGRISQHGKTLAKNSIGKTREDPLTFYPNQPRASSPINDNYCIKVIQTGLLAWSKLPKSGKTMNSYFQKILVNSFVVNPVLTAPGPSQKKDVSSGMSGCYQGSKLKYVKDVLCVDQLFAVSILPVGARL